MMSSHQIAAMAAQQQAMFGNFQSYAQQITPPYGAGPGMGAIRSPGMMGGYQTGPAPMMAPPPPMMPGWNPGYGGGVASMAMQAPYAAPNAGFGGAIGEQLAGSALGGLSTVGSGLARAGGYATMAAGGLSMLGMGGVGMAAAAGPIGMLGVGALEAGAWGAQQLYGGFQERQQMNRSLRRNFGGMMGIGAGRGGTGFGNEEMGQISSMVRGMANQDMYTSFDELTRVMDKTAGMGLYRGVQSAQQFQTKFKQTVSALKEIAQVMQTSLEGATQYMEQARNQGFFSGRDISATLTQTRMAAGASGMSMDQLMAIRSQGTQMGRMMGMRGRQGANAMMNMATNIGVGMQTGAISDEVISEATGGLTGAEGAQAAAGMLMQSNARWMRRGAGRVMLAGLWDPNTGGINMERLQQAMGGGTTFQQIRAMGRANVASSGGSGSEFFANEERIAGALQETGLAGAVQFGMLEQHIQRARGLNADSALGERFMRRQSGWNQQEFELNREMFRNMPRTLEERRLREAQGMETMARTRAMEGTGVQGAQRRIQHWWESSVMSPARQMGDDLVTSFTKGVDQVFEQMEGTVKTTVSERTKNLLAEYAESGKPGRELMSFNRFQEMRRGLKGRIDEGGIFGSIGRAAGLRPETIHERLRGINAFNIGLKQGATENEQVAFINQFNEDLSMQAGDFGISATQLSGFGKTAKSILESNIGYGDQLKEFRQRSSRFGSMSGTEKQAFIEERITMYNKDSSLAALFAKAKTPAQRYALARTLDESTGLGSGIGVPVHELAEGRRYEDLQRDLAAAKGKEKDIINRLAGKMAGSYGEEWVEQQVSERAGGVMGWLGFKDYKGKTRKIGGKELADLRQRAMAEGGTGQGELQMTTTREDVIGRYSGALTEAMTNEETRNLLLDAASGDQNALDSLAGIATGKGKGAEAIGMLLQGIREDKGKEGGIKSIIGELGEARNLQELLSVSERVKETGRALTKSLSRNEAISEAANKIGPGTMTSLQAIAKAQSSGNWDEADRLRRRFYTDFVGKEGAEYLAGALAADPSGGAASLGVGMQRASRLVRELTGRGGEEAALRAALGEVGLDVRALGGEEFQKGGGMRGLMKKLKAGEITAEQLTTYFKDKEAIGAIGVGRFQREVDPWLSAISGGLKESDIRRLAVGEGAETAQRGSMAGAPESRQTLAEKQVDILTQMLKLQIVQAQREPGLLADQASEIARALKINVNIAAPGGNSSSVVESGGVVTGVDTGSESIPF